MKKYAFGVDSDQAALLPDYADYIPTSALKNVGNALIRAIKKDIMDELEFGTLEYLGFAEGGVELVEDAHYEEMVPEDIREEVASHLDYLFRNRAELSKCLEHLKLFKLFNFKHLCKIISRSEHVTRCSEDAIYR